MGSDNSQAESKEEMNSYISDSKWWLKLGKMPSDKRESVGN